jgi:dihydropteroate synthase
VIEGLAGRVKAPISIDTYKPGVARAALSAGASIVNDITAGGNDGEMWRIVAEARAAYVVMHMQGIPATMQIKPSYQDVKTEVGAFFESRLQRLAQAGVPAEQVILDVGIGFGKTRQHNLDLLAGLAQFRRLGRPILVGVSRKSFLGAPGAPNGLEERLAAGLACACWAAQAGANIIRTHDVRETLRALRMFEELIACNDKR